MSDSNRHSKMTTDEINKHIAEFMGWRDLEWHDATSNGITTTPAGWYGRLEDHAKVASVVRVGYVMADYANSVDDLIPVIEKLRAEGKYLELDLSGRKQYSAGLWDIRDKLWGEGTADSMAMAICNAVIAFLGEELSDK